MTIIDDDTLENTETFTVALYTDYPEGVLLTRDRSIVEITDNEEGTKQQLIIQWLVIISAICDGNKLCSVGDYGDCNTKIEYR